jgi:hypothetical protein
MLLSPLRYINPISGNRGGSAAFSIAKSFYLDGVNEGFNIPNADISPYITGTNTKFTFLLNMYLPSLGVLEGVFSVTGGTYDVLILKNSDNKFYFYCKDLGVTKLMVSSNVISSIGWLTVAIVIDLATPSNSDIFINELQGTSSNTLTNNITASAIGYRLGYGNGFYGEFNLCQFGLLNDTITFAEFTNWKNGGKPKSITDTFPTKVVRDWNADNSNDTAQFTWTDTQGSVATSINMEDADKTTLTPY